MNSQFSKDLYRYYGEKGESLTQRLLRPVELKYIALAACFVATIASIQEGIYIITDNL